MLVVLQCFHPVDCGWRFFSCVGSVGSEKQSHVSGRSLCGAPTGVSVVHICELGCKEIEEVVK